MSEHLSQQGRGHGLLSFLLVVILLAITAAAALAFLVVSGILSPAEVSGGWSGAQSALLELEGIPRLQRLVVASGAVVVGVLALSILMRVLRPGRQAASFHLLTSDDNGFVVIDTRGIATVAHRAAISTRGVVDAAIRVVGSGTTPIRLRVEVGVYPGANVKRAGDEARESVRQAIEQLVGIPLRDVLVNVRVLDTDRLTRLLD